MSSFPRSTARTIAAVLGTVGVVGLTACAPDQAPIDSTQWQVTDIYSGPDRSTLLSPAEQSRTHLVFGATSFTGQVGCYTIAGPLSWGGTEEARKISVSAEGTDYSGDNNTGTSCLPADEDIAQRLVSVLAGHELTLTRPADNSLRLSVVDGQRPDWETAPSITMISGPSDSNNSGSDDPSAKENS